MRTFALLSKLRHRGLLRRSVAGLAAALVLAPPSVLIAANPASASTGPVDDRLNSATTGWWTYGNVSAATLGSLLSNNGARLTDLQVDSVSPLTFSATMVRNTGSYSSGYWWYYGLTAAQVSSTLSANNARLISLAPYTTTGTNTLFAAVMVPNTGANAKGWAWYYNISPAQIGNFLSANTGRLIRMQSAVINGTRQYSVIMVSNTGTDNLGWYYY